MIKRKNPSGMEVIGQQLTEMKALKEMYEERAAEAKEKALATFNKASGFGMQMNQWEALDAELRASKKEIKDELETNTANRNAVANNIALTMKGLVKANPEMLSMDAEGYYIYKAKGLGSVKYKPQEYSVRIDTPEDLAKVLAQLEDSGLASECFKLEKGEIVFDKEAYLAANQKHIEANMSLGIEVDPLPGIHKLGEDEVDPDSYKVSVSSSRK